MTATCALDSEAEHSDIVTRVSRLSRSAKLTLGYVGLAALDAWLSGSSDQRLQRARVVTKPLLMPVLTASLATDPEARRSPLFASTVVAQAFGWGGDVLLLREGTEAFAAGAGSFGVGHLSYITGFRRRRNRNQPLGSSRVGRIAKALVATGGPTMAIGAAREELVLGPAVLGYTGLLSGMLAHAGNLDPALPAPARRRILAGAALFAASDTLLGLRHFWWKKAPARAESVVMVTYTAGQLLISRGTARAAR